MQKPSEPHKLTSDNNIIKCKKPVYEHFKIFLSLYHLYMRHGCGVDEERLRQKLQYKDLLKIKQVQTGRQATHTN